MLCGRWHNDDDGHGAGLLRAPGWLTQIETMAEEAVVDPAAEPEAEVEEQGPG